jgi:hypothetical protein
LNHTASHHVRQRREEIQRVSGSKSVKRGTGVHTTAPNNLTEPFVTGAFWLRSASAIDGEKVCFHTGKKAHQQKYKAVYWRTL